ncbi:hypothetical protein [Brachybacterium squillarum]|uniref:hypothetical protein n=1 Tax=Brachybacterium squillarum TaxID=661979 RepID=UPI0002629760|nr:hypothetical protein [Brachybacterium squillarum]
MLDSPRSLLRPRRALRVLATTTLAAGLAIGASACSEQEPAADPGTASDTGGSTAGGGASDGGGSTRSPEDWSSEAPETRAAGDDPTPEEPTSTWEAPADPEEVGPTAAPEVHETEAGIDETAEVGDGLVVSLGEIGATEVEAATPGEVDGPALVVEVEISNDGEEAQDLGSTTVSVETADGELAVPTFSEPFAPFEGELAAGESTSALYVFLLEDPTDREVTVTVQPTPGDTASVFTGTTP